MASTTGPRRAARLATIANTRWGSAAPQDAKSARRLLLDAAEDCFERYGVAKTTVEDIARAARVGRATVYRYFTRGRDEIVLNVALRDLARLGRQFARTRQRNPTWSEFIVDGVIGTVQAARERPKVALLFTPDAAGLTSALVGGPEALQSAMRDLLAPGLSAAVESGEFRADLDLTEAAEWITRIITSLLVMPSSRRPKDERRYLREYLLPAFFAHNGTQTSLERG